MNMDEVVLSVICLAYNHEKYIRQTLEGFVNQRTCYKFEVLINDDASTDCTADIIEEHSKKVNLTMFLLNQAKGKYFAFCEGDDYWIDSNKIQMQIEYMEDHKDCTLCIHNAYEVIDNDNRFSSKIKTTNKSREIKTKEVIVRGGGFCATNSILSRTELINTIPDYMKICMIDYIWQIYLASCGKTYCFDNYSSVYRVSVPGSWTERMYTNLISHTELQENIIYILNKFNIDTHYKYNSSIKRAIKTQNHIIAENIVKKGDKKILDLEKINKWYIKQNFSVKSKLFAWRKFPNIYGIYRKIRKYK